MIQIKRTYDGRARRDGRRILVERLWPRGMKKEAVAADAWMKEVAPSTELRRWFDHRPERWDEFRRRYRKELAENAAAWAPILDSSERANVTLLYSAHDPLHNGAVVLRDYLAEQPTRSRSGRASLRRTTLVRATKRRSKTSGAKRRTSKAIGG
jgi:uncharacterized protein YeaO (DUF488 family)